MSLLRLLTIFGFAISWVAGCHAQSDTLRAHKSSASIPLIDFHILSLSDDNLAATAFLSMSYVDASFENRFLLKELMTENVRAAIRYGPNAFAAGCAHFGYSRYGELSADIGYARNFGKRVAIGMRFFYLMSHAADYPAIHSVTFDVSLYAALSHHAGVGFSVYNPALLKYGIVGKTVLPVCFRLDFNYRIGKNVILFSHVEKELKSQFAVEIGAGYRLRWLYLSVAAQLPEPQLDIGIRMVYRKFIFGTTCQYRHPLGFVPRVNITLRF